MLFDFTTLAPRERYKLLLATVVPRPIAWVVTQNAVGQLNAAPFSFFNALSGDPPVVGIGISSHEPGRPKDSRVNIRDSGEFVVNLVSEENARAMNVTAIGFDYGVNELAEAGLKTVPSTRVKPPRIADSPVALECKLLQIVDLGPSTGLVLGQVLAMHVRDEAVLDTERHHVDTAALKLIGRMHGAGWYARTSDLFEMPRIAPQDWKAKPG
jgi:flavin reductase (DIM6/NTAB) family NADH-FMN oxidoreductase RutF